MGEYLSTPNTTKHSNEGENAAVSLYALPNSSLRMVRRVCKAGARIMKMAM